MKAPRTVRRTWRTGNPGAPDYQETKGVLIAAGTSHVFIPNEHLLFVATRLADALEDAKRGTR